MEQDTTHLRVWRNVSRVLDDLKELDKEMPVQQMQVLFYISTHDQCVQRDMITALGLKPTSASRNIAALSKWYKPDVPGLGLVTWVDDLIDRRSKRLMLTAEGRKLMASIAETLS